VKEQCCTGTNFDMPMIMSVNSAVDDALIDVVDKFLRPAHRMPLVKICFDPGRSSQSRHAQSCQKSINSSSQKAEICAECSINCYYAVSPAHDRARSARRGVS
jgi:hypothetical protein